MTDDYEYINNKHNVKFFQEVTSKITLEQLESLHSTQQLDLSAYVV